MAKGARSIERERFWRQVMKKFATSGLSVRAFCRAESLSEASFYGWRRELRLRDAETKHPIAKRTNQSQRRAKETPPPSMSPALVEVVALPAVTAPLIEIETPAGYTIRLHGAADPQRLAAVLGCLPGAASC